MGGDGGVGLFIMCEVEDGEWPVFRGTNLYTTHIAIHGIVCLFIFILFFSYIINYSKTNYY